MTEQFENFHLHLETINETLYKGIQLYFSPLNRSEILFIGINPGIGYFNYHKRNVKKLSPLEKFEYNGQKYILATQTKRIFKDLEFESTVEPLKTLFNFRIIKASCVSAL